MCERIKYYDIARGIALFLVVAGHLFTAGSGVFLWIFSFHMPLFFLISGCCTRFDKYGSFLEFLKRKSVALLLPYVGFSLFGFFITLIVPMWRSLLISDGHFNTNALLEFFYYTTPSHFCVGATWFLVCLFVTEIFAYGVYYALKKYQNAYMYIAILCSAAFGALIIPVINTQITILTKGFVSSLPFKIDVAFSALVFFLVGYMSAKKSRI